MEEEKEERKEKEMCSIIYLMSWNFRGRKTVTKIFLFVCCFLMQGGFLLPPLQLAILHGD